MTCNSLYPLEPRGLLTCPIIGVAVSDRSDDDLRSHVLQPLLEHPPPVRPYAQGSWGSPEGEKVLAGFGHWHHPWVAS